MMGFAENFAVHLVRQILAERSRYPAPDRAEDVFAAFNTINARWAKRIRASLEPFMRIGPGYTAIVAECRRQPSAMSETEYYNRMLTLFDSLQFADVEEAVWDFLNSRKLRRDRRWT
jgi:hypothetical protein